jgi:hypothetical protein
VGITCSSFQTQEVLLKRLVAHRNDIAHGKKLIITDLNQFQRLEDAALIAMHDLALEVIEFISSKAYQAGVVAP